MKEVQMRRTLSKVVTEKYHWQLGDQRITIRPVYRPSGFTFIQNRHVVPATLANVRTAPRMLSVGFGGTTIYAIEHLLAAFVACGITDADIELDKAIVPYLPMGMKPFVELIQSGGITELTGKQPYYRSNISSESYVEGDRVVELHKSHTGLSIHYIIDFPKTIGFHEHKFTVGVDDPMSIAPSRPFRELGAITSILFKPLIPVFKDTFMFATPSEGIINSSEMNEEEPVKHKIVDFLGAIGLLGHPVEAMFNIFKSGHSIDVPALSQFVDRGYLQLVRK